MQQENDEKTQVKVQKTQEEVKEENYKPHTPMKFKSEWTFYENIRYFLKDKKTMAGPENVKIIDINNLEQFAQFWKNSVFSDYTQIFSDSEGNARRSSNEKGDYQILGLFLFRKGIEPMWEDEKNKLGYDLNIRIDVKSEEVQETVKKMWKHFVLLLLSEEHEELKDLTGITMADKSNFKYAQTFTVRFEFWNTKSKDDKESYQTFFEFIKKQIDPFMPHGYEKDDVRRIRLNSHVIEPTKENKK